MPTTMQIVKAFETQMATSLSITVRLGFPEVGKTPISYPLGAVVFDGDDYRQLTGGVQRKRIGQVEPAAQTVSVNLYLFAADEYKMLALVDSMRAVKSSVATVTADSTDIQIRYGPTRRTQVLEMDKIENTVVTEVTFTW